MYKNNYIRKPGKGKAVVKRQPVCCHCQNDKGGQRLIRVRHFYLCERHARYMLSGGVEVAAR